MIISLRVQSGVQRRRYISVQIQQSPTAFLVFTCGADPKPTHLNLNRLRHAFCYRHGYRPFIYVSINIENSIVPHWLSTRLF